MYAKRLARFFEQIDARVRVSPMGVGHGTTADEPGVRVGVAQDAQGSFINIRADFQRIMDLHVLDVEPDAGRLLLRAEDWGLRLTSADADQAPLFLVGRDDLSLYAIALPLGQAAQTAAQADALVRPHRVPQAPCH